LLEPAGTAEALRAKRPTVAARKSVTRIVA
jgi:hypothetical protein